MIVGERCRFANSERKDASVREYLRSSIVNTASTRKFPALPPDIVAADSGDLIQRSWNVAPLVMISWGPLRRPANIQHRLYLALPGTCSV
jgi:hypothetical protein